MKSCNQIETNLFYIWISPDSIPYERGHYRTWFYFSIKGIETNSEIHFSVRNMGNQGRIFKNGLRPVYRSSSNMKWRRIQGEL